MGLYTFSPSLRAEFDAKRVCDDEIWEINDQGEWRQVKLAVVENRGPSNPTHIQ
jgi:hypothetical protein